ncbi:Glycosyltransferase [Caballeronia glathei]|jgi:glycosyltransferase involved in cell wall biosynthesis|uniref:Glycosyl transferase n=1 Tax=Caballeronia glathei TaxID=60547 RepID=A0A069PMI8_9BURK|nr:MULTISPECIES: glycosyltransferase family 4 protein [Burkholderiaceae]KDR41627.1 glycosyl transferase [Caballeronia glathei]TCK42775.1 glycosyltransferase involved in cell wall biosynthesis [Paraburkholderia sp. BL8N3]CDY75878.1 Glycosyltransferase [Caballeronia glathei]
MNIAIVTHVVRHNDGQGRVNYEIARAALAEGMHVTLLASHVAPELLDDPRLLWVPVRVGRFWPTKLVKQQVFALKCALWLRMHRKEYDVLHVNGFIAWTRADVNTAHFVHGGWLRSPYYPFRLMGGIWPAYQVIYSRLNSWLERWAYRRSRIVAAVSEKVAQEIRVSGIPGERIEVVYNGVDTSAFKEGRRDREAFGLPADACLLLFVGDLRTPRKNLDTVLQALLHLPANVQLAVAGFLPGSPYPDEARVLGIADRVHFLGLVKDMPTLMHSVDAFVFPSRYEAMSLSLLEALAAGLPVVTARTAGGAEIIGEDCGIVLDDPDDAPALAGAIKKLADAPALRREMGEAARSLAGQFGWARMARRYLDLYRGFAATPLDRHDARNKATTMLNATASESRTSGAL